LLRKGGRGRRERRERERVGERDEGREELVKDHKYATCHILQHKSSRVQKN
jgi:hypothetical protein